MLLNNNIFMPELGIGTYLISPADAENSVCEALRIGYRLVDTAGVYANERAVGRGIRKSGVEHKEIFVSTKLWISEYNNPMLLMRRLKDWALTMSICFMCISEWEIT